MYIKGECNLIISRWYRNQNFQRFYCVFQVIIYTVNTTVTNVEDILLFTVY